MDIFDAKEFQSRLRVLIGTRSVNRFAMDVGLGDNLVRRYLDGAVPGLDKAARICAAEQINLAWLATGRGTMRRDGTGVEQTPARYQVEECADFVVVPHFDVKAARTLGTGKPEQAAGFNAYRRDWWSTHLGIEPKHCFTLDIVGDSMAPRLTDQDRPIVNREEDQVLADAIYVFRVNGEVFVKYLERVPGLGLRARSENARYAPWDIGDPAQHPGFVVIGRAVFKETGERL